MKFLRLIILFVVFVLVEFNDISARYAVQHYMHSDELMFLVHGNIKGSLLWLWDMCYYQHPILTSLYCVSVSSFALYLVAPLLKKMKPLHGEHVIVNFPKLKKELVLYWQMLRIRLMKKQSCKTCAT